MTKMPADHSQTPANPQGETASVPAKASATALTKVADTALSKRALALPPAPNAATWSARQPIWTGIAAVAVLIAFFGGWGMLTTISGAIVANGVVQVEQNRQVVQHPDGGVVAEIAVQEAQTVKSGDLLIRLDGAQIKASLAIVEGQLFDAMARKARLEAERDDLIKLTFPTELTDLAPTRPDVAEQIEGQKRLFVARLETQNAQIDQLGQRLDQIASQSEGIAAQMAAINDQITLMQP